MPAQIGSIETQIDADSSGFTSGVGSAVDALSGLVGKLGKGKAAIAGLAAAGAAAAAGGLAAATSQAMEFERTIAGAAARAGATQRAMNRFGAAAKQASLDSAFGAKEAGGALRFLAKSGFEVQQATKALPGILKGATAAGMGAAEMGEIASNALRAFGRSASQTSQVMDVLVKASTNANTSVQELGQGISIVGGLANKAGMDIESTAAVMAKLQDAGISASRAATAMRAGISRLLKPTGDAKTAMSELNVSAKDAQGNFRGLIPVLTDLQSAGASSSQMLAIFGRRAGPTLQTALAQGGSSLKSFEQKMRNAQGTTKEIASFIRDSATEQIKVFAGSLATLGSNIGELVLPPLKLLIGAAQKTVTFLNTMVNVVKDVDSMFSGWSVSLKDTAKNADNAAKSTQGMGQAASAVKSQLRGQQAAQEDLNRSLRDFIDLQDKAKEKAFGGLKQKAQKTQAELRNIRDSIENNKELLAATSGGEVEGMRSRFEGVEVSDQMKEDVKRMEELGILEDERKKAARELKKQRMLENRLAKKNEKVSRKLMAAADAKLKKQQEQNKANQRAVRQERKQAKLKKKQSEPGKGIEGPDLGLGQKRGKTTGLKTEESTKGRIQRTKRNRNFAKASRQWAKHSAKAKKNTEGAEKAQQRLTQQQRRTVDATIGLVKTTGQAATNLMRATGASQQTSKVMGAAIKGATGLASAMAAAAAASWSTASAISVATAGISAVAGTVAAAASAAGKKPGSQNISTGGTTSAGGGQRSQEKFADLLAERIADEQEKRELFRQTINIESRTDSRGRNGIDSVRQQRDRLEEAEMLEGV